MFTVKSSAIANCCHQELYYLLGEWKMSKLGAEYSDLWIFYNFFNVGQQESIVSGTATDLHAHP